MVSCEADIMKGSGPAATNISDPSVFNVAGDDSFARECSAERANVLQVIGRSPETAVNHEQEREGTRTIRKAQLGKVLRIRAVLDAFVESRWRSFQDVAQAVFEVRYG